MNFVISSDGVRSFRVVNPGHYRRGGGRLSIMACVEDPPLISKILAHVRRREALTVRTPRSAGLTTATESHLTRLG